MLAAFDQGGEVVGIGATMCVPVVIDGQTATVPALAPDGAQEASDSAARTPPPQHQGPGQVGGRRSLGHSEPVDDDPAPGSDQHIGGMEVEVADPSPAVVQRAQPRQQVRP